MFYLLLKRCYINKSLLTMLRWMFCIAWILHLKLYTVTDLYVFIYPPPDDSCCWCHGLCQKDPDADTDNRAGSVQWYSLNTKWGGEAGRGQNQETVQGKQIQKGPLWHRSFNCAQNTFVDQIHALQKMKPFNLEYPHYFFFTAAHLMNFTVKKASKNDNHRYDCRLSFI